tara:strand:+ start:347 stop:568 length:222 start_codon:yes stop_codon:yes gene_type:complete
VNINEIENIRNPFASKIIIHPRYFDKKVCKLIKKSSETEEFNDTKAVINIIKETALKNLGLLILFILRILSET